MFVCSTFVGGKEGCSVVVLNKKALENMIVDLMDVKDVEMTDEFLILRWWDKELGRDKVVGVYIHPDKEDTREVNCLMIKQKWEVLREEGASALGVDGAVFEESDGAHPFAGRQIDVNQLFPGGLRGLKTL